MYFGTDNGEVFAYAHGKERRLLKKIECEHQIQLGLVFANGTLYVPTGPTLYAVRGGR